MYKKILVPLDGSTLAECVIPHVEDIARSCQAPEITFVRVVEPFIPISAGEVTFTQKQIDEFNNASEQDARRYLNEVMPRIHLGGVTTQTKIIIGRAAESLADYATANKFDLIVIATHGRSGFSRWVWGSVADRILRAACVPVLMVRAPGCVPVMTASPEPASKRKAVKPGKK